MEGILARCKGGKVVDVQQGSTKKVQKIKFFATQNKRPEDEEHEEIAGSIP